MTHPGFPDGRRWTMLLLIGAVLVFSMTTWFSAAAVLPELRWGFHLSAASASWITNALQLGFVVAALGFSVSGLADSLPPRGIMAGSAAVAALANGLLIWAPSDIWLFASRFVTGMALAGIYPPALKLIASWFVGGRGLAMGAAVGALTLGSSAPYLIKALGAQVHWPIVVAVSSLAALVSAGLALFVTEGPHGVARPKFELRRIGGVLRDPAVMLANVGYFGHMWELYAMWGWFLVFAGEAGHAGVGLPLSAPLLTFLVIAVGVLGCLAGGVLADRLGREATAAAMMLVSGACALGIGVAFDGPAWLFIAIALVWGFSVIADSAQFSALVSQICDPEAIGAALSLQIGIGFLLTLASIRLTPFVAERIGWHWTFAILAPGPFTGAAAILVLRARSRR